MSPEEKYIRSLTRFEIGDDVVIAGDVDGTVTGKKTTEYGEDEYLVFYFDNCGNHQERWIRDTFLDAPDDDEGDGDNVSDDNVVCFACEREARKATKH